MKVSSGTEDRSKLGIVQSSSLVEMESIIKAVCSHTEPCTTEFNVTNYTASGESISPLDPPQSQYLCIYNGNTQVTGDITNAVELSTTTVTRLTIQITTADTTV